MTGEILEALQRGLAATPTRRLALGLAAVASLGSVLPAEGKKRKKGKDKERCPSGQIREGTVCATLCEVNEDCGGAPVFCHTLADQSARVCIISDGSEPEELPPCPSRSAAECAAGQVCFDFAMAPVCGRPL